jgi:DNA-binding transcriptional ArsR family regulator
MTKGRPNPAVHHPLAPAEAERVAALFKALADPTRLRLVQGLVDRERCVHELCDELNLEQSAVSHQLRLLRDRRVVRRRKSGRHAYYVLDDEHVKELSKGT